MKYRTFNLVADVIDNSISPALIKGDTVAVRPGFKAENGHMVAILVTNEKEQTTDTNRHNNSCPNRKSADFSV